MIELEKYQKKYRENILYYIAHTLDPRLKLTNIREQCGNEAENIITEICDWLKKEYLYTPPRA
jgi:hypothetical protein